MAMAHLIADWKGQQQKQYKLSIIGINSLLIVLTKSIHQVILLKTFKSHRYEKSDGKTLRNLNVKLKVCHRTIHVLIKL